MEIKKKLKNQLLATFICTLMLITPHTTAQLYANFIDQQESILFNVQDDKGRRKDSKNR